MVNSDTIGVYRESLNWLRWYFSTWIIHIMAIVSNTLVSTGCFCTVTFLTNDGEVRTINGRTGVKKYMKGTETHRTEVNNSNYFLVYTRSGSPKFDAPRNIAKNRIISIRAHGIRAEKNNNSPYAHNV